jgi:hypothetical protein
MHEKSCSNGCEFATKFHLMSYANKNTDGTYSDADYLYTCTKLEHTVSFDSTVYKLGCATYNNIGQNARICEAEALVAEIETKLDEIEKIIPPVVAPIIAVPVVPVAEPVVVQPPVERVEPRFVPEPSVVVPSVSEPPTDKPKPDVTKKRGRRTTVEATVVNPVVGEVPKV